MKRSYWFLVAVLLSAVAMWVTYLRMGIFFETNDDRVIAETLSGAITRTPSAYTQVVSYLLSAPLALLYRMAGGIPWYGLCLILFHVISYAAIFESILSACAKGYETPLAVVLCGAVFLLNLYSVGFIQWTSTAALLATAGYIYLIMKFDNKAVWVCAVFELLGFLLRSEAMLMIQPFGAGVLLGFFWSEERWKEEKQRKIIFRWIVAIIGILAIGTTSRWIAYRSDEWKAADAYYDARVKLMDYYGIPPYEEVQSILDKYQITQTEYEGFANWIMVGSNIDAECLEELVTYIEAREHTELNLGYLLRSSVEGLRKEEPLAGNRLAGLLWVCVLLWMILARRKNLIIPALGLGAVRTAVWCYIIYRGRMPNRVTYPLFFAETIFLLSMILKTYAGIDVKTYLHKAALLCVCGVVAFGGYKIGQAQYRFVSAENKAQALYILGHKEIREYCGRYPDNRYILDAFSFSYYKGSALETDIYTPINGIYSGTWISQSPVNKRYEREYLGDDWKELYVIVYDDGQPLDVQKEYISARYYAEKTGRQPVLSDRFTVSHGGSYLVWYFEAEKLAEVRPIGGMLC